MTVKKVFTRKTKSNHFEKWFLEEGNEILYLHLNHGKISRMRHRITINEDVVSELQVHEVPTTFYNEVQNIIN